jgi:hypothetical protein
MSGFDEIITPEEQLEVLEATRETAIKLWVARQTVIVLRLLLKSRIEGPQTVDNERPM